MDQLFDTIPSELTQHILQELKHKYLRESQSITTSGIFFVLLSFSLSKSILFKRQSIKSLCYTQRKGYSIRTIIN